MRRGAFRSGEAFTAKVGPDKGVTRDSLFVTSKLWNTMHHPDRVKPALRKTLADLKLEYLGTSSVLPLYAVATPPLSRCFVRLLL